MRGASPRSDRDRAVRLIYLNRTAFNGLYRVNQKNKFNVPFQYEPGTKLADQAVITAASAALQRATLRCQDFRKTLRELRAREDVIYVDPPYTVKHDSNGFRRYINNIFSWKDQEDLANLTSQLVGNGAKIVVSNAHHDEVRKLYPSTHFHSISLERATCMAADIQQRGSCVERLLISKTIVKHRSTLLRRLEG